METIQGFEEIARATGVVEDCRTCVVCNHSYREASACEASGEPGMCPRCRDRAGGPTTQPK